MGRIWILTLSQLAALLVSISTPLAFAQSVLLESAEMGTPDRDGGTSVSTAQWVGWRFETDVPLDVHQIGAHILAYNDVPGELFAAFVRLDSIDALPHGAPFTEEEVVATTLFRPNFPSDEFFTPMEATLLPGSHALVIGTGMFGATGEGALHNGPDQPDIPPTDLSSFIYWSIPSLGAPQIWRENLASQIRMTIAADVIHLPGDYNVDSIVDDEDYAVWKAAYGNTGVENADGNGDLSVDAVDYTVWRNNVGNSLGAGGLAAAIPEPSVGPLVIAALALVAANQKTSRP